MSTISLKFANRKAVKTMSEIICDRDDEELRDSYRTFLLMRLNSNDIDADTLTWGHQIIDEFQERFGINEAEKVGEAIQSEHDRVSRVE